MGMNHIELLGFNAESLLLHEEQRGVTIDQPAIQPE
jgi:hypothetical protein